MSDPEGTVLTPEDIQASKEFLASPAFKTLSLLQQRRDEEHRQQMNDLTAQIATLTSKVAASPTPASMVAVRVQVHPAGFRNHR